MKGLRISVGCYETPSWVFRQNGLVRTKFHLLQYLRVDRRGGVVWVEQINECRQTIQHKLTVYRSLMAKSSSGVGALRADVTYVGETS